VNERIAPGPSALATMATLCAIWGLQQVAVKVALAGIGPILQVGLRSVFAAVLVFAWARWRGLRLFDADGTLKAGLVAGLLFALEFLCIFAGLEHTGASRMVIFLYTSPCFTVLGLHWFVPGERIGWRHGMGIALAFVGILVAFGDGLAGGSWLGDGLGILAAVFWAATTVIIRASALARVSAAKTLLYQLAVSALLTLPLSLLMGEAGAVAPTTLVVLAMAYQALIVAFASYLTWFWLLTRFLASRLMVFAFLTPLFGVLFGVVLLHERMSGLFGFAALLVVTGIVLVNVPEAPARRSEPAG
jgi:drug/metabolite transporter (DMT)-like permease